MIAPDHGLIFRRAGGKVAAMTKPETDDVISQPQPRLLAAADWADYELLDSGNGLKLERFGRYSFVRPEPQAMWAPRLCLLYTSDAADDP